jgi:PhoH-like ATPase
MRKTYVLDTNVLLHDPNSLNAFQENEVVIPLAVIEEIDNQKRRQDEIGRHARQVSRILDALRTQGRLSEGVATKGGGPLRVELNYRDALGDGFGLDASKYDNRILALAVGLRNAGQLPVVLVTKDLNLRIKADVLGLEAEDFQTDRVAFEYLYSGFRECYVAGTAIDEFYANGCLSLEKTPQPYQNEFVLLRNAASLSQSALCRYHQGRFQPLTHESATPWGIRSRNKEQKFALELLLDNSVQIVTLVGPAGTGKTLLALAAGLDLVVERGVYRRLLIMRPIIPVGEDLGYLPGTKEEKLRPWMQPIYDNLEYLFSEGESPSGLLDEFTHRGLIELETFTHIRGRSIPRQFILCDEAQNLTPNMVKALATRVGEGTKLVLTGDPDQIDHPYLDASSNGLTYLVDRLREESISGHILLTKGERSAVAERCARLL